MKCRIGTQDIKPAHSLAHGSVSYYTFSQFLESSTLTHEWPGTGPGFAWNGTATSQTWQRHTWNWCHTRKQKINASTPRHINELEPDPGYAWNGTATSQTGQWHSWNWYHAKINATAPRHIHVNELEPDPSYSWNGTAWMNWYRTQLCMEWNHNDPNLTAAHLELVPHKKTEN